MKSKIYRTIQDRIGRTNVKVTIVVGTGSSISVDCDFGMGALEKYLKDTIPKLISHDMGLQQEWEKVLQKRSEGVDFENSLNEIQQDSELLDTIIRETARFVTSINHKHVPALLKGEVHVPISTLFKKLSNKLSTQNPTIDIITPNYDLLLEYALRNEQIEFTDGFYGNIQKELNWDEAGRDFLRPSDYSSRRSPKWKVKPHFRLHKIHGSLNYFELDGKIVRDDTLTFCGNDTIDHFIDTIDRFIITPGSTKYKRIVETREFYKECDKAIEQANSFLFVGYGFNDNDIDIKIRKELNKGKNAVIVTKQLIGKGKDLLTSYPEIIAIEENPSGKGSCIHYEGATHDFDENLWKIDTFVHEILK